MEKKMAITDVGRWWIALAVALIGAGIALTGWFVFHSVEWLATGAVIGLAGCWIKPTN